MAGGRGITKLQAKIVFTWLNSLNCNLYNSKCQRIYVAKLMANIASLLCAAALLLTCVTKCSIQRVLDHSDNCD